MNTLEVTGRTLTELEGIIERGQQTFVEVGQALLEIRDRRLYREQGHRTFEAYCQKRWGWTVRHGRRLMQAARTVQAIEKGTNWSPLPANESQVRELHPLMAAGAAEVVKVWQDLRAEYGDDVTAERVKRVVTHRLKEIKRKRQQDEDTTPMTPSSDDFAILHGDAYDLLPHFEADSINAIITDPPYDSSVIETCGWLAQEAARLLVPGGSLVLLVGQYYLPQVMAAVSTHLHYRWTLAYLTPGGQSPQVWVHHINCFWKPVIWLTKGADEYVRPWMSDVLRSDANDKRFHRWGQSVSGMAEIVERFTLPGEWVLDPFCGAGTVGVAALTLGRRFRGIDRDEKSFTLASRRCKEAVDACAAGKNGLA